MSWLIIFLCSSDVHDHPRHVHVPLPEVSVVRLCKQVVPPGGISQKTAHTAHQVGLHV